MLKELGEDPRELLGELANMRDALGRGYVGVQITDESKFTEASILIGHLGWVVRARTSYVAVDTYLVEQAVWPMLGRILKKKEIDYRELIARPSRISDKKYWERGIVANEKIEIRWSVSVTRAWLEANPGRSRNYVVGFQSDQDFGRALRVARSYAPVVGLSLRRLVLSPIQLASIGQERIPVFSYQENGQLEELRIDMLLDKLIEEREKSV